MYGIRSHYYGFFAQALCLAIGLPLSTLLLVAQFTPLNAPLLVLILVGGACLGVVTIYQVIFVYELKPHQLVYCSIIGLWGTSVVTFQYDLLVLHTSFAKLEFEGYLKWRFLIFNCVTLALCVIGAFLNTARKVTPETFAKGDEIELWQFTLCPKSGTYDIDLQPRKFKGLTVLLALAGFALMWVIENAIALTNPNYLRFLIMGVCFAVPALIINAFTGVTIGESLYLIYFQRKQAIPSFVYCDMKTRMKWRHDYVKYHLPAPIRRLNLKLFNQHVQAYEQLDKGPKRWRIVQ
ncbi:MAG: hypothetical protein ACK4FF_02165 [Limnobacter sp.]|uniref:hypothetical protein n=1 Tax=Limnobacter sp. TaxID=2003368 RepID=UPI003918EF0B